MPVARPRSSDSTVATVSLLAAGVLWGTGGLAGSVLAGAAGLHPLAVATYRLLVGGALASLLVACTGGLRALPRTRPVAGRLLTAGALLALFQAGYFAAVVLTSVSVATMITIGSAPVFVAVAGARLDRRAPDRTVLLSVLAAVTGLVLLTAAPGDVGGPGRLAGGVACALAAGAAFATLTLVTRRPVAGLDPLRTTAFGCLIGGVALVPFAAWPGLAVPVQADVLAVALYLGAVPTALAYVAYFSGLRSAHPTVAALSALLEPVTAALLAALVLGDRLGIAGWCGAALLLAAIAVSHRASATAPAEEPGTGTGTPGTGHPATGAGPAGPGPAGGDGRSADVDPPSVAR